MDRQVTVVVVGLSSGTRRDVPAGRFWKSAAGAAARPTVIQADVTCGCGIAHEGAPEAVTGCGVSFRIELETVDPGGPVGFADSGSEAGS